MLYGWWDLTAGGNIESEPVFSEAPNGRSGDRAAKRPHQATEDPAPVSQPTVTPATRPPLITSELASRTVSPSDASAVVGMPDTRWVGLLLVSPTYAAVGTLAVDDPRLRSSWSAIHVVAHETRRTSGPTHSERNAEIEANRDCRNGPEEDQAPHAAPLPAGFPTPAALEHAITA